MCKHLGQALRLEWHCLPFRRHGPDVPGSSQRWADLHGPEHTASAAGRLTGEVYPFLGRKGFLIGTGVDYCWTEKQAPGPTNLYRSIPGGGL